MLVIFNSKTFERAWQGDCRLEKLRSIKCLFCFVLFLIQIKYLLKRKFSLKINSKTLYEKLTQFLIDGYLNKVRYCFPPPHCILLRCFLFIIILKVWFALRLRRSSLDWDADEGLGAGSQQFDLLGGGRDPVQPLTVLLHHRVPAGMEISKYISFVFL